MQHVPQALLLKMALKFDFKFTLNVSTLSNVSWNGVVSLSAIRAFTVSTSSLIDQRMSRFELILQSRYPTNAQ